MFLPKHISGVWRIGKWRRGRDSNPRYGYKPYNGLANRRLQPLGHPSTLILLGFSKCGFLKNHQKAAPGLCTEQRSYVSPRPGVPVAISYRSCRYVSTVFRISLGPFRSPAISCKVATQHQPQAKTLALPWIPPPHIKSRKIRNSRP